jgi:hypothetical protein
LTPASDSLSCSASSLAPPRPVRPRRPFITRTPASPRLEQRPAALARSDRDQIRHPELGDGRHGSHPHGPVVLRVSGRGIFVRSTTARLFDGGSCQAEGRRAEPRPPERRNATPRPPDGDEDLRGNSATPHCPRPPCSACCAPRSSDPPRGRRRHPPSDAARPALPRRRPPRHQSSPRARRNFRADRARGCGRDFAQ